MGTGHTTRSQQKNGFVGHPQAWVVAPETMTEVGFSGIRQTYVSYKIRVSDGLEEWTVNRRFGGKERSASFCGEIYTYLLLSHFLSLFLSWTCACRQYHSILHATLMVQVLEL